MNTPAHLIFGKAAFAQEQVRGTTAAALFGALIPDLSLYLLVGWHFLILNTPADVVFNVLYFSSSWQAIFRIDNSFLLWGIGISFAIWAKRPIWIALCGAALLHLVLDFPLHHNDGRAHFWPMSDWIFQSPVSYWNRNHHAGIVGPIEVLLVLVCSVLLYRRFKSWIKRALLGLLLMAELAISNLGHILFG